MPQAQQRYSRLGRSLPPDADADDGGLDQATRMVHQGVPWKSISLAVFLFSLGALLLTIGLLVHVGHIKVNDASKGWALIVLGVITFLPGFYESRIAYYTWRRFPGYTFAAIPGM